MLRNLAFVCIAKMDYKGAKGWLKKIEEESDNQIELADVYKRQCLQRGFRCARAHSACVSKVSRSSSFSIL